MRSDYLGDCALFSGLPEALNDSQFLTPRLTRDQRRAAIEGPARVFGGGVEPALVGRLLNDMGPEPDQLPLMQHALMRLWVMAEVRAGLAGGEVVLTLDDYTTIGGLAEALDRHAEEAFATLAPPPAEGSDPRPTADQTLGPTPKQKLAEALFRCLSEREYSGRDALLRDVRRPTPLGTVAEVAGVMPGQVAEVVEAFRAPEVSFLTPPAGVSLDTQTVLDVTHESLIRRWKRLQVWVEDEARSAETYRRLEETARLYAGGQASLLVPPELDRVVKWRDEKQPGLPWAQRYGSDFALSMKFLVSSQQRWKDAESKAKLIRLAPWAVVVGSIGLVLFVALWRERHQTEIEKKLRTRAESAEKEVKQKNVDLTKKHNELITGIRKVLRETFKVRMYMLSNESLLLSQTNPQQSVLLAAEAVKEATFAQEGSREHREDPTLAEVVLSSETALRRALTNISGRGLKGHRGRGYRTMLGNLA
jgi:hypothetical protein